MAGYEYRVIPAPSKGTKAKGVKTPEGRFAHSLQELMNQMGADGWEYQRAETLPSTERAGLTGSTTNWRHVLIFRRALTRPSQDLETKGERFLGPIISPPRAPANDTRPQLTADPARAARRPAVPDPLRDEDEDGDPEMRIMTRSVESLSKPRKNPDSSDV